MMILVVNGRLTTGTCYPYANMSLLPQAPKTRMVATRMPYMNGGELHDFLKTCHQNDGCMRSDPEGRKDWSKVNTIYTTPYILGLFHDIVSGVEVFHRTTGMHHIDLKPGNVMLNCQGKNCFAAVIDLGIACDPNKAGSCGLSGTPLYMPPEVYQQNKEGMRHPSRDVWALGIILYQLMYARLPPFFKDPKREVVRYDVDKDPNIPGTKKVDTLIMQMLWFSCIWLFIFQHVRQDKLLPMFRCAASFWGLQTEPLGVVIKNEQVPHRECHRLKLCFMRVFCWTFQAGTRAKTWDPGSTTTPGGWTWQASEPDSRQEPKNSQLLQQT